MANKGSGGGNSGGSKPSGGGNSGGSKPSGGGSSGGSKPSGGGSSSSGGSSGGGSSKPSGGGSGGGSSSGGGNGGGSSKPAAAATPTKPSSGGSSSGGGSSGGGGSKNVSSAKVEKATQQIKSLIGGINESSPGIADPKAYQKALDVLKSAGKDTRVQNLKGQVQTAKTTAKVTAASNAATRAAEERMAAQNANNVTKDDLSSILSSFSMQGGVTAEDLEGALAAQQEDFASQLSGLQEQYKAASSGLQQQRTDTSDTEDLNAQFEAFNPNLFSSLLGELESSKYRQKEWNERSAKAAYKY